MWNWLANGGQSQGYQTAIKHQIEEQLKTQIRTYNSIMEDKLHEYTQRINSV